MAVVQKKITGCKSSHTYSIYKMQMVSEKLDEIILTGNYEEKVLEPIPLTLPLLGSCTNPHRRWQ
jgi:hypothetical protein